MAVRQIRATTHIVHGIVANESNHICYLEHYHHQPLLIDINNQINHKEQKTKSQFNPSIALAYLTFDGAHAGAKGREQDVVASLLPSPATVCRTINTIHRIYIAVLTQTIQDPLPIEALVRRKNENVSKEKPTFSSLLPVEKLFRLLRQYRTTEPTIQ
ncbi:hypothetical protein ACLOJK_014412 [Asimina triloba]